MDGDLRQFPRQAERRDSPRLEVEAVINGVLARGNLKVVLHDLGFGGFAVESPITFTSGTHHEFRFVTSSGLAISIMAAVVYSNPVGERDGMEHQLTGFRYVTGNDEADLAVSLLIDAAIAPLTFP